MSWTAQPPQREPVRAASGQFEDSPPVQPQPRPGRVSAQPHGADNPPPTRWTTAARHSSGSSRTSRNGSSWRHQNDHQDRISYICYISHISHISSLSHNQRSPAPTAAIGSDLYSAVQSSYLLGFPRPCIPLSRPFSPS
ncbi:NAD-glutamate dehydrogenase [Marssonina coronariae]|uniref:NAD-glutamate dehydrogenase n=1 Tax=Diplocarpon coronariae TaxID=2795749 RepID=A0A218YXS1_9HELO|nr:NAD-glutamate dehydrogenase [Marssonina coronariae]